MQDEVFFFLKFSVEMIQMHFKKMYKKYKTVQLCV